MKKVLLDTNIIIHRESTPMSRDDIGVLFNWLDKMQYVKCIHKSTIEEVNRHRDKKHRDTMNIKLQSYESLNTVAPICSKVQNILDNEKGNDKTDTFLLNEVHEDRVDILITEDKNIHNKAEKLGISEKVFKIDEFLHKITTENPELVEYKVLSIRKAYFGNLSLRDSFFDSFKEDYKRFEQWFNRKSEEICYVSESEKKIVAFLYLKIEKEESYPDISPTFKSKERLKIGTLKVINTGYKLGERFLRIIFENALKNNVDEIYVTVFPKYSELIELLKVWGFIQHGHKKSSSGIEDVFVRDFSKKFDINDIKSTYPFISLQTKKFIVPIYPEYHTELLPDSILKNEQRKNFIDNKHHRNAIHKVYISRSWERNLSRGDVIIFYRTGGWYKSVVTTIGIIESKVENIDNEIKFIELCKKRSVFTDDELKSHWNRHTNNKPFIVNFLYAYSLPNKLNLKKLIELRIIKNIDSVPRGFEEISTEQFNLILKESNAQKSFIID